MVYSIYVNDNLKLIEDGDVTNQFESRYMYIDYRELFCSNLYTTLLRLNLVISFLRRHDDCVRFSWLKYLCFPILSSCLFLCLVIFYPFMSLLNFFLSYNRAKSMCWQFHWPRSILFSNNLFFVRTKSMRFRCCVWIKWHLCIRWSPCLFYFFVTFYVVQCNELYWVWIIYYPRTEGIQSIDDIVFHLTLCDNRTGVITRMWDLNSVLIGDY